MIKRFLSFLFLCMICSGCIIDKESDSGLKPGDGLPDFSVIMNDGSIMTDDMLKGKVSVVMFFHTGCSDCQRTLPVVQDVYDEFALKNVVFVLISREEGKDEIEAYWRKNGLDMPYSAQNDRTIYELFAESRIPRIYINDRNGIIRSVFTDDPVPSFTDLKMSLEFLIR